MSDWKKRELERLQAAVEELKRLQQSGQPLPPGLLLNTQRRFQVTGEGLLTEVGEQGYRLVLDPIIAYKQVHVVDGPLRFCGVGVHQYYKAEDEAECKFQWNRLRLHEAPEEDCSCGFYALKQEWVRRGFRDYTCYAEAEVELSGKVIVQKKGYRAQYQRVLGLYLDTECQLDVCDHVCDQTATVLTRLSDNKLAPACTYHAHPDYYTTYTATDLANAFGVEVRWGHLADRWLG